MNTSITRLTLAASALVLALGAQSPATAAPVLDNNGGQWTHALDDTVGLSFDPAAIAYDGVGRLLTLNPAGAPPPTSGAVTTSPIAPSSFDAWGDVLLRYTSSSPTDLSAVFRAADGTDYPLTLTPAPSAPWTSRASLAAVPASVTSGRLVLTLTRGGAIAPTLQGLRVTWSPRSLLAASFSGPPTVQAGDTATWRVAASVSLVNAQNLVAWVVLPAPNAPAPGSTTAPPALPTTAQPQDAPLAFVSATDGGQFNATGGPITVLGGVTVPANAVYWALGPVSAGHTFALRFTARARVGTLDQTFFEPRAHLRATNATGVDTAAVTTRVASAPAPFLRKSASNTFFLFGDNRAYAGSAITYTLTGGNFELYPGSRGEDYFQACAYDDVTPLLARPGGGGPAIATPPGITVHGGGQLYLGTGPAPSCGGVTVPPNSVWWSLDRLDVGERFTLSYTVTLAAEAPAGPLLDGDLLASTARLRSGFAPELATASYALRVGVPDDPQGLFAKGDMIRGSASISAGEDNLYATVTYGDPVTWLLHTANSGISALDDVVMVDKVPAGTTFDAAFLPGAAGGQIYYNTCGPAAPADCATRAASDPPDLDPVLLLGPSWTTVAPAPHQVRWVAFVIPRLASPYFPEPGVPTAITAELSVTVDLPADLCPAADPTLANVGNFLVHRYTPPGGATNLIDGGPLRATNAEHVQVTKLTPDLSRLSVGDSPDLVIGAGAVTYHVTVFNQKPAGSPTDTALDVALTLEVPTVTANGVAAPLAFQSLQAAGGAVNFVDSDTLRVTWPSLPAGQTRTVALQLKVPQGVIDGTSFNLTASVSGRDDLCGPTSGSASESTQVAVEPYLIVDKQVDLAVVGPGDAFDYRLSYVNVGDGAAVRTWLVDRLPPEVAFAAADVPPGGQVWFSSATPPTLPLFLSHAFPFSDAVVRAHFVPGTVAADGRARSPFGAATTYVAFSLDDGALTPPQLVTDALRALRLTVTVRDAVATGSVVANDALIVAEGLPQAISDKARGTVSEKPSIRVTKTGPAVVTAGETFDIAITWWNDSTHVDDHVVLTELLPANLTLLSAAHVWNAATPFTAAPVQSPAPGGQLTFDFLGAGGTPLPLEPLQGGTLTLTVRAGAGVPTGTLLPTVTTATATKTVEQLVLESTAYATLSPLVQNADLWVRVQPDQPDPPAGEVVTWSVLLSNEGGHGAGEVDLAVTLPPTLVYLPGTAFVPTSGWSLAGQPDLGANVLTFSRDADSELTGPAGPAALPGASGDVRVVFQARVADTVPPATDLTVCATAATTTGEDPDYANTGCATARTPLPDVWVDVSAPATVQPGAAYQYAVRYGNHARQAAPNVVLVHALPDGPTLDDAKVDVRFLGVTATGGQGVRYWNGPPQANPPVFNPANPAWSTTPSPQTSYVAFQVGTVPPQSGPFTAYVRVEARDPASGQTPEGGTRFEACATATVGSAEEGADHPANNKGCATTRTPGIDVEVRKRCEPEGAFPGLRPGETARFVLELENTGTVPAYGLELTEVAPAGLELVSDDAGAVLLDGGSGQLVDPSESAVVGEVPWTRQGDAFLLGHADPSHPLYFRRVGLSPGAVTRITLTGRVADDVPDDTTLRNEARVKVYYRPDWAGSPAEEILSNNSDSCAFAVFRPDPFVVKTVVNRGTGDATAANAGDVLDYTLEYGNAGHAAADGVLLEDVLPDGVSFVAGSVTGVPAGARVLYDDGDFSFSYTSVAAAGTVDPAVTALRVVWDAALGAPASGGFSQTTAIEFEAGAFHQTAADAAFEAVVTTTRPADDGGVCAPDCDVWGGSDKSAVPRAATLGSGYTLAEGEVCAERCDFPDGAEVWTGRVSACEDTYFEATEPYFSCLAELWETPEACADLAPAAVWRSCWEAECPTLDVNSCEYNVYAGSCSQAQDIALGYYRDCVFYATYATPGDAAACDALLPANDCARCVDGAAAANLGAGERDWHLRWMCSNYNENLLNGYLGFVGAVDYQTTVPHGERAYGLDVVPWDRCWGGSCPAAGVDSCELGAWSEYCQAAYAGAMEAYTSCVAKLAPVEGAWGPQEQAAVLATCAPLRPEATCTSCLVSACAAGEETASWERHERCTDANALAVEVWAQCVQTLGWADGEGSGPVGASVEEACGPAPVADCGACAPTTCPSALPGSNAWANGLEDCIDSERQQTGVWLSCLQTLDEMEGADWLAKACDAFRPTGRCLACTATACPAPGTSSDGWDDFADTCYWGLEELTASYTKCLGAAPDPSVCAHLRPVDVCSPCVADSCPADGADGNAWSDFQYGRCREANVNYSFDVLRSYDLWIDCSRSADDNATSPDCDGLIADRSCADCYARACPSADATLEDWRKYGDSCAEATRTEAWTYTWCMGEGGPADKTVCARFTPEVQCDTCWIERCPSDPAAFGDHLDRCRAMAAGLAYPLLDALDVCLSWTAPAANEQCSQDYYTYRGCVEEAPDGDVAACEPARVALLACLTGTDGAHCAPLAPAYPCAVTADACQPKSDYPPLNQGVAFQPTYTSPVLPREGEGRVTGWDRLVAHVATAEDGAPLTYTVLDADGVPIPGYEGLLADAAGVVDLSGLSHDDYPQLQVQAHFPAEDPGLACRTPITGDGVEATSAHGMSDAGVVVGGAVMAGLGRPTPYAWTEGAGMVLLPCDDNATPLNAPGLPQGEPGLPDDNATLPYGEAFAVSPSGAIIGRCDEAWTLWTASGPGVWTPTALEADFNQPYELTDSGYVRDRWGGLWHPEVGSFRPEGEIYDVNEAGLAVGYSYQRGGGVVWERDDNGTWVEYPIEDLEGENNAWASGIGEDGIVFGESYDGQDYRATYWRRGAGGQWQAPVFIGGADTWAGAYDGQGTFVGGYYGPGAGEGIAVAFVADDPTLTSFTMVPLTTPSESDDSWAERVTAAGAVLSTADASDLDLTYHAPQGDGSYRAYAIGAAGYVGDYDFPPVTADGLVLLPPVNDGQSEMNYAYGASAVWRVCDALGLPRLEDWTVLYTTDKNPSVSFAAVVDDVCQTQVTNTAQVTTATPQISAENDSSTAVIPVETADLAIALSVDRVIAQSGDDLTYTLTWENLGPGRARSAEVTLHYSDGQEGRTRTWALGHLPPGASGTLTLVGTIDLGEDPTSLPLGATADVATPTVDCNAGNDADSVITVATDAVNLYVTKTGPPSAPVGEAFTYTLTVGNNGNVGTNSVNLVDELPDGLTFVAADPEPDEVDGGTLLWDLEPPPDSEDWALAAGARRQVLVTVIADDCALVGHTLANYAAVSTSSDAGDAFADDNEASAETLITAPYGAASLTVEASRATAEPGDALLYTVHFASTGSSPVRDAALSFTPPGGAPQTVPLATLSAGQSGSLVFPATASGALGSQLTATASLAGAGACPVTATAPAVTLTAPGLHLVKSASTPTACGSRGDRVTWSLVVTNTGATPLADVLVADPRDPAAPYVPGTLAGPGANAADPTRLLWTLGTLAPGAALTLSYEAQVPAGSGALLANTATATAAGGVSATSPAAYVRLACAVDATLTKAWTAGCALPGAEVEVALTLRNTGAAPLAGLTVTDPATPGLTFLASDSGGALQGGAVVFAVPGSVPAGATRELRYRARVGTGLTPGALVLDRAQLAGAGLPPRASNQVAGAALDCDDGSVCTADACLPAVGCVHAAAPDATPCTAADPCAAAGECQAGLCVATSLVACDDANPCTDDRCEAGACLHDAVADGTACDDDTLCTTASACAEGVCVGTAELACDDQNPCTADGCDAATGCTAPPVADGTPCDDQNACSADSACEGGACTAASFVSCDDDNLCTLDFCDPAEGCVAEPVEDGVACDDRALCTTNDRCAAGACAGEAIACGPPTACQLDGVCNPATGVCDYELKDGEIPVPIALTDLGTLGGATSRARALNDGGVVVGESETASGAVHAFRATAAGGMVDLTPAAARATALGVNPAGVVAGVLEEASGARRAFRHDGALALLWEVAAPLGAPGQIFGPTASGKVAGNAPGSGVPNIAVYSASGSTVTPISVTGQSPATVVGLNDAGVVVGHAGAPGAERVFRWSAGASADLGTLGGAYARATAINGAGAVVGYGATVDGDVRAFKAAPGATGLTALDTLCAEDTLGVEACGVDARALALDDAGRVLGWALTPAGDRHAVLWDAQGQLHDLGTLGGPSSDPVALADGGGAIGAATTAWGQTQAVYWSPELEAVGLGTLGLSGSRAVAVNAAGQVAGELLDASGLTRAFLWDAARGLEDLGTLGGPHAAVAALNALGQVAGTSATAAGAEHAFLSSEPETACVACEVDDAPPALVCPVFRGAVECLDGGATLSLGDPSVSDACGRPVSVTSDALPVYPVGVTPVTFTATDSEGNAASCQTTVVVADTTAPTLHCPEATVIAAEAGLCGALVTLAPTATDACDGSEGLTLVGPTGPTFFGPGATTVRYSAVDRAGNVATCETVVEVTGLDALTIACDPELTVDAPADFCGYPEALTADVVDVCAVSVTVSSAADHFPIGTTTVRFTADNARGEEASCETRLTVRDVTAPTVVCGVGAALPLLPTAIAPAVADACGAAHVLSDLRCVATAADGSEREVSEGCDVALASGTVVVRAVPRGDVEVRWTVTATDTSGNVTVAPCATAVDDSALDRDKDGIVDVVDNCPDVFNPEQVDTDLDGAGDACDLTPADGIEAQGGGGCAGGGAGAPLGLGLAALGFALLARRRRTRAG